MRNVTLSLMVATVCAMSVAGASEPSFDHGYNDNAVLYAKDSRPFGKSLSTWGELSTQWIYAQPFAHNPFFDPTGANCAVDQHGPVWYLAPIAGMMSGNASRSCTIPRGKAVLLSIAFVSETYPCPDPHFTPAPGQSLYDFLAADAKPMVDMASRVQVSLDNRPVPNGLSYRFPSENLYSIKGDPSLQSTFDPCITGNWQPAMVDGFFMMFKPLRPGRHTLVRRVTTDGDDATYTYNLYVQ